MPFNGAMLIQVLTNSVWSVAPPRVGFTALNPIPEQQRYVKVGGGIGFYPFRLTYLVHLTEIGVSAQYFMTYYGRNTIVSRDLYVGLDIRLTLF
jgi:hypothetical protein